MTYAPQTFIAVVDLAQMQKSFGACCPSIAGEFSVNDRPRLTGRFFVHLVPEVLRKGSAVDKVPSTVAMVVIEDLLGRSRYSSTL